MEEINRAFFSSLSFYAYRFPRASMLSFGSSEGYLEGLGTPGFVISFFDPSKPFITIPYAGTKRNQPEGSLYNMPDFSTSFDSYKNEVTEIIKSIDGNPEKKIVAARVIVKELSLNIGEKFYDLCQRFPDAFVFCFATPATGCWIGASPELLLEADDYGLHSMALAGTRISGSNIMWDSKNLKEQEIVTEYILEVFKNNGLNPEIGATYDRQAGNIEHICTPITVPSKIADIELLRNILHQLSPTPALCGRPKPFALELISKLENFDRGCYGGFCGPYHSPSNFNFNVVIRCASVSDKKICKYVGGGITNCSNVDEEWHETEIKAENL